MHLTDGLLRGNEQGSGGADSLEVLGLADEFRRLRSQVALLESGHPQSEPSRRLPGRAAFLQDGRVLCREREFGDSRYPYGTEGFTFWVNASGLMHGNRGLYFLFLPALEGQEPSIAFFAGCRRSASEPFSSHALLPVPFVEAGERRVVDRYTVVGHDATYFVADTPELSSVVRVFVEQHRAEHAHINFSTLLINRTDQPLEVFTSTYMNPFCRHQFAKTNEDCWFKQIHVDPQATPPLSSSAYRGRSGVVLPSFVIATNEDVSRFQSNRNDSLVRRAACLLPRQGGPDYALKLTGRPVDQQAGAPSEFVDLDAQVSTSRASYVGSSRRSLNTAAFLSSGRIEQEVSKTVFSENAIAGDLLKLVLPPGCGFRTDHVFSTPDSEEVLKIELDRAVDAADVDESHRNAIRLVQQESLLGIRVQQGSASPIDAETFNQFIPYLKKQVSVCAQIKGYMQPSPNSLIGFRDVMQAIEGHLLDRPQEARLKIEEALGQVLLSGRCPRQYSLTVNGTPGRADLREFIDQGVWAVSTAYSYVANTGEAAFLEKPLGYRNESPGDESITLPAQERESVLEHLLRIMDYLEQKRDEQTGLVLALYGDWNDALDGLGIAEDPGRTFGSGVSIMTSLQLYQCCWEMIELLTAHGRGRYEQHLARYRNLQATLRKSLLEHAVVRHEGARRILHGWGDRRSYLVGSFCDSDGLPRDGLTSNAFWVLSGMIEDDPSLKEDILSALARLDSKYGYRTFSPGFAPDAPGVGRIGKLPQGTAENGAVYVHATTFAIAALFRLGEAEEAWRQLAKVLPFSAHHQNLTHSPFVMPNSYVENAQLDLDGQSMNDWQTGCSNVLLKLLVREAFGFNPRLERLRIAPALWQPFDSFELQATAQGRRLRITYSKDRAVQSRSVTINSGEPLTLEEVAISGVAAAEIPYDWLSTEVDNEVRVVDPDPS